MADQSEEPLLAIVPSAPVLSDLVAAPASRDKEGQLTEWAQYEYVNKSIRKPGAVEFDAAVTGNEIRAAASYDPYPIWIYGALITPEDPGQGKVGGFEPLAEPQQPHGQPFHEEGQKSVQVLEEQEIRELLIDRVGHHFCWGGQPARSWSIQKIEDCNSYSGTLETFIEERDVIDEVEPYAGGTVDEKDSGRALTAWEVDMKAEFPLLFVSRKEARKTLPHSEVVERCQDCSGRGELPCPTCNPNAESGRFTAGQTTLCPACRGRGLIAHMDGSDTNCKTCKGEGKIPCAVCGSRGLIKCERCRGEGALLHRKILVVRWRTLLNKRVSATKNAASVPDEVFHRAKGVSLYQSQSHNCEPAYFPKSPDLSKFSASIISDRVAVPPAARMICERHQISLVPVTRVVMGKKNRSFMFYIIGLSREVYLKDYPARCCLGLCSCGEMCTIC